MKFRDFLGLAETLAEGTTEAEWRTSISRAYYGSFHLACDFLRSLGFRVPRSERGHSFCWLRISNCANSDLVQSGRDLNDLRGARNEADYDEKARIDSEDAEDAMEMAKIVVNNLDTALNEPARSQIQETIKRYEKDILKEVTWK